MTVQETLEAELATAKTDLQVKEAALEKLKAEAMPWLSAEMTKVKEWFDALKAHL